MLSGDFGFAIGIGGPSSNIGSDRDLGFDITTDAAGNVYVAGVFSGTADFDPGPGVFNLSSVGGSEDTFVAKYSPAGALLWAQSAGSAADFEEARGIAIDADGNVLVTGEFRGTVDFDAGPGTSNLTSAGAADIFVTKLDSGGNSIWARAMGGPGSNPSLSDDVGHEVTVDAAGNVYVTGSFKQTADFDPGPGTFNLSTAPGKDDAFVLKLDSSGNLLWARDLGGSGLTGGFDIALDSAGNVHTLGEFTGTSDFDPGAGAVNLASAGSADIYVSKLDPSGNFVSAFTIGASGSDTVRDGLTIDSLDNLYVAGGFSQTVDFDPGAGTLNLTSAGGKDGFVAKYNASGNVVWSRQIGGSGTDAATGIDVDSGGDVYATGILSGTVDFDPGPDTLNLTSAGDFDVFVSRFDSDGNLVWARAMGGSTRDQSQAITVDAAANVYTTGLFTGTADFDPGPDTFNLTSAGGFDIFVSKLTLAPEVQTVEIDIKPGSDPNSINLGSNGNVPVAIFSTATFDATTVDPLTLTLADAGVKVRGKGVPMASEQDVNNDGLVDLVVHIDTSELVLTETAVSAELTGQTFGGQDIAGADSVNIVQALYAEGGLVGSQLVGITLTEAMLPSVVQQSISIWAAGGVSTQRLAALNNVDVQIGHFSDSMLGAADLNTVWLDSDAAGYGWSLHSDVGGVNLRSVVTHEFGHILGFDHDVMGATLDVGVRQVASSRFQPRLDLEDRAGSAGSLGMSARIDGFFSLSREWGSFDTFRSRSFTKLGDNTTDRTIQRDRLFEGVALPPAHEFRSQFADLHDDTLNIDGILDSNRQEAEVSLTGETVDQVMIEGMDTLDLMLAGKRLRDLLDELAAAGSL